ncbi:MAG: LLM class flavin-dependent oxidoreductase [Anaerolineae bacterium]|nr:LLM class flavin-dependent oxidoreductase [Anaerolineae bacterium]
MTMRFSLRFNNDLPPQEYVRLALAAEAAGFDQFWVSHDLFWRHAWTILGAVAQATTRIHIGTCIVNPYTQHVADIAMAAATLDELSRGRALLGFGAGAADFLRWVGIAQRHPLAVVRDSLTALDALLRNQRPSSVSAWTPEAYLRFPTRRVPIYLGAMSPHMLRLMGEQADGGLPLLFPPEHLTEVLGYIEEGVKLAGRDLAEVDVAACVWCSVSDDREAARAALRAKIAYYGHAFSPLILSRLGLTHADFEEIERLVQTEGDLDAAAALVTDQMLQIGLVGTAADLIPRLEGLVAAGAHHLSFGPPLGPDPLAAIQVLGHDVLPYFRATGQTARLKLRGTGGGSF